MDIVKKNIVSIVCGVIALLCVILIFVPFGGMYTALTGEVDKSKKVGDDLAKTQSAKRSWPSLDPNPDARIELTDIPTEADAANGKAITDSWTAAVQAVFDREVARQNSVLKPLVPGLLPKSNGLTLPNRFKDEYAAVMGLNLTAAPGGSPGGSPGYGGGGFGGGFGGGGRPAGQPGQPVATFGPPKPLIGTPLVGRMPPSDAEIGAKADERAEEIRQQQTVIVGGVVQNQPTVDLNVAVARAAVGDRLRDDVARQSMIYVDPALAFVSQDRIIGTAVPSDDDIFLAQVGLWLQQEVCRSIYEVNKPALDASPDEKGKPQGVLVAPVKHLVGIRFTLPYTPPTLQPGSAPPTDTPALPATPPAAKVPVDFTKNPLGQVNNDLYDVLPFNMVLVCDAATLPQTLDAMAKGRYLSLRAVDVQTVDSGVAAAHGYIYGGKPVVQVTLHGQYLLLRKFTGQYAPANIIRGILAPPAAGPGGSGS